ncbi:MAG: cation transporter, partial [Patescibacteria group bacterium]
MKNCQVHIQGMHCRSCEMLIEDELKKIDGVQHVLVNHTSGIAHISYKHEIDNQAIENAVQNAGYSLGENGKIQIISKNKRDYVDLGIAFFIVIALFTICKILGIFDLGNSISGSYSNLPVVFLIGLTAGVSTCMALVGGLVLGAAARFSEQNPVATKMEKFKPHL